MASPQNIALVIDAVTPYFIEGVLYTEKHLPELITRVMEVAGSLNTTGGKKKEVAIEALNYFIGEQFLEIPTRLHGVVKDGLGVLVDLIHEIYVKRMDVKNLPKLKKMKRMPRRETADDLHNYLIGALNGPAADAAPEDGGFPLVEPVDHYELLKLVRYVQMLMSKRVYMSRDEKIAAGSKAVFEYLQAKGLKYADFIGEPVDLERITSICALVEDLISGKHSGIKPINRGFFRRLFCGAGTPAGDLLDHASSVLNPPAEPAGPAEPVEPAEPGPTDLPPAVGVAVVQPEPLQATVVETAAPVETAPPVEAAAPAPAEPVAPSEPVEAAGVGNAI